ncbi:MAG: glycosyltransferase family 2 protein [Armatimonadota bacterium]
MAKRVSAIIPAHNEADLIGETVAAVREIPGVTEVVVVDDASTDDTAQVARSAGADRVIILEENAGKGGALNAAWPDAGEVLLLLDADLGASAREAEALLRPVLGGDAEMTVGIFGRKVEGGLAAKSRGFGSVVRLARFGIRAFTGKTMQAPLSGQRALVREIVERMGGFPSGFGVEVGLTIDALRMGYRVEEVPVEMVHRPSGRDIRGFVHRGKQMAHVLRTLVSRVR